MATEIDIAVTTTTYDVTITATPNEYIVNITTNGGVGAVESVNGQTGIVVIPIPTNTSDLVNDGENGTDPFITAADVVVPNLDEVLEVGNVALDTSIEIRNTSSSVYSTLNYNQINVFSDDKMVRQNQNGFEVNDIINGNVTRNLITGIEHVISGSGQTNVTFETPTGANSIIIPNQSGTIALLSDIAVDSVNGQTGVVVLDAADVGADAITTATTGAVISFATPQIYNSIASPSASNITDNLTGARIGVVQKIYHNAGTTPTFPAGWVRRGTGTYVTSTLNIIYAEWSVGTTVEYWITQ